MYYHSLSLISQGGNFLVAVLFGLLVGIFYSLILGLFSFSTRIIVLQIIVDVLFWAVFAFSFFSFDLVVFEGRVRLFEILGVLTGFLVFYLTLGKRTKSALNRLTRTIIKPIHHVIQKLLGLLNKITLNFKIKLQTFSEIMYNCFVKFTNFVKGLVLYFGNSKGKKEKETQ